MQEHMPKLGVALMAAGIAVWMGGCATPTFAADAPVVVTGQTQYWDPLGTPIACAGTGQGGAIQAGLPYPTPRFKDNGDGTMEDMLNDLIWLQNANCFGLMTWARALTTANTLADGNCGLTDGSVVGDWRLPNIKELQSLLDFGHVNPALPGGHPFLGVQSAGLLVVDHAHGQFGPCVGCPPVHRQHRLQQQAQHQLCLAGPGGTIAVLTRGGFGRAS